MNNGLMLIDKHHMGLWLTYLYKEYEKHCYLIDIHSSVDDILNIIKENRLKYIIIPQMHSTIERNILKSKMEIIKKSGINIIVFMASPAKEILDNQVFKEFFYDIEATGIMIYNDCVRNLYRDWLDLADDDIFHHMWGVSTDIFKDYGLNKNIDICSTGKFSSYKYRRDLHFLLSNFRNIRYERFRQIPKEQTHPNYIYARKLNESWINVGGCSLPDKLSYYRDSFINDTFPKNIEIAGSKSCLLTSDWGDREYLGFEDGKNCIIFKTLRDAVGKSLYYLEDKELLGKITKNGYDLVQKNYNVIDTMRNLFKNIERRYVK